MGRVSASGATSPTVLEIPAPSTNHYRWPCGTGILPRMGSTATRLAEGLVDRLRPVVPEHIVLTAEQGGVTIQDPSVPHAWCHVSVDAIVEQAGNTRELIEGAALSLLSTVQDFVAEFATDPWPGQEREMPLPGVEWVDDELHAWYGEAQAPALRLPPLPLGVASEN